MQKRPIKCRQINPTTKQVPLKSLKASNTLTDQIRISGIRDEMRE